MSEIIAVVGQTGSGKSASIRNLNPAETAVIAVTNKALPWKGWKRKYNAESKNYKITAESDEIVKILKWLSTSKPEIKTIIIDDFQYLMSSEFMNRSSEKGYEKFTEIARHAWDVINTAKSLREDLKVFIFTHDEIVQENFAPKRKIKTIGKMLDDKVTLEGLFTIVFFTDVTKDMQTGKLNYSFITQNDGSTTAKSPMGMFDDFLIPNDLVNVIKSIDEYYMADVTV